MDEFTETLWSMAQRPLTEKMRLAAKASLLDHIGVREAGRKAMGDSFMKISGAGEIFASAFAAHYLELDDGHRYSAVHPASPILPVLLRVAPDGEALLHGLILGYEAALCLGSAIQPGHRELGHHSSGSCGAFGAAAAAAFATGMDKDKLKNALSAALMCGGSLNSLTLDQSTMKPINVARAAQNGYSAYLVASAGFHAPNDALGGKFGFLFSSAKEVKESYFRKTDADEFEIFRVYQKPYAACRHTHAAVEGTLLLYREGLRAKDVKSFRVKTYAQGIVGHGKDDSSGKMSTPFSCAAALIKGRCGAEEFSQEMLTDPEVLALADSIELIPDDSFTALVPAKRCALVEIETKDGRCLSKLVEYPKGEPENPLTKDEQKQKFRSMMIFADKTEEEIENTFDFIQQIEKHDPSALRMKIDQ